jgi:hypothetical protein
VLKLEYVVTHTPVGDIYATPTGAVREGQINLIFSVIFSTFSVLPFSNLPFSV